VKELEIIEGIKKQAGKPGKPVAIGIGDDCAVLYKDKKNYLLWASDMLVEGTHFKIKEAGYKKIGKKAAAVNISDIAAMGGVPEYILVSLGVPSGIKKSFIGNIYKGILGTCKPHEIKLIGGDIVRSKKLVIDVSILGTVEKNKLLTRSGAKKGDLILITGPVRDGKKEHLDFRPRLKEARFLTGKYKVSSMIDTSDGIALDARRICSASGVGCKIYSEAVPLTRGLSLNDALYFGESFELLFTMSATQVQKLFSDKALRQKGPSFFIIGEVTHKKDGFRLVNKNGQINTLKKKGFKHL
jgi:thiamine-monophosphate kinase